ncbi:MAG: 16S rRNA (cytosine(1402)-N(4))-methyltransferase RsmH [Candidatus Hydrogenedentes bacterium]|nr:16S rRNA (cytosine(1402)-N(4))-methyltransferase RsmH [Candidatus Hydrogenedentota bacterium]
MHVPVLAGPALEWLRIREDGTYVDCTAGAGGHMALIVEWLKRGRLIALDRDPAAVELTRRRVADWPQATVLHRNYAELAETLAELRIKAVDGVLFDVGISSMQLDDPQRGFSFQEEGPLDMRMDPTRGTTAAEWLADVDEVELSRVLRDYGDIRPARRIARALLERRASGELSTTRDVVEVVRAALGIQREFPEEVRTVFQAIRMAVNDELNNLRAGLTQAVNALAPEGRVVAISFHSGEDRVVKNTFREYAISRKELRPDGRILYRFPPQLRILTRKPIGPNADEVRANPRAHSAKLRVAERLPVA